MSILQDLKADLKGLMGSENKTNISSKNVENIPVDKSVKVSVVDAQELDSFTPKPLNPSNVNVFTQENFTKLMAAALRNRGLDSSNVAVVSSADMDAMLSPSKDNISDDNLELEKTNSNRVRKSFN